MEVEIKILSCGDDEVLKKVAPNVFDHDIDATLVSEFLADSRHHLIVAIDCGVVVGFVSAIHYVHPDKPAELWINELGVAPSHQNRGLGKRLLRALLEFGRAAGYREAWVLTERSNATAMRVYRSVGGSESRDSQVMFSFRL